MKTNKQLFSNDQDVIQESNILNICLIITPDYYIFIYIFHTLDKFLNSASYMYILLCLRMFR